MVYGTLFEENKEEVSIYFNDNILSYTDVYIVENVDAVFHPVASALTYNAGVLSQTQADADWRVILAEAEEGIEATYTLVRNRGETDEAEYEIVDVLSFAGEMHLFVKMEGL